MTIIVVSDCSSMKCVNHIQWVGLEICVAGVKLSSYGQRKTWILCESSLMASGSPAPLSIQARSLGKLLTNY